MSSQLIDYAGYQNCISLSNPDVEVVLGPHVGGRVLAYTWRGDNALALDPRQDGWLWGGAEAPRAGPSAGRFDFGPEMTTPQHPALWLGAWEAEIINDRMACMTSVVDPVTGIQLLRDFELDPTSSRFRMTQTMRNQSGEVRQVCHWGRTFGRGHGICVVPLTRPSRFPKSYILYGPGPVMNFAPDDPAIEVRDETLLVLDAPQQPKLGLDSHAGWFAYLMENDLMLVKQFPTYPDRPYAEMAANTISLWYFREFVCELEPIGPSEMLAPGDEATFSEVWYLKPYAFPKPRRAVRLAEVRELAERLMSQGDGL
jgi:hypothetical protein